MKLLHLPRGRPRRAARWAAALVLVLGAAGSVAAAPASAMPASGAAAARAGHPAPVTPGCSVALRSNAYALASNVLAACGFHRFPRVQTRNMPGGGHEYGYVVAGARVTIPVPPAGFNPLTASPRQLARYSLPARPRNKARLAAWRARMAKLRPVRPPAELISKPITASTTNTTSGNWSGYVADSTSSSYFYQADSVYTEPTLYSSVCSTNYVVMWSGMGGWYTGKLGQAGTIEFQPSGGGENQAWWEILPTYPSIVTVNLYATVGQYFESDVSKTSSGYNFYLENWSTGKYLSINVSNSNYDGRTADFVVERPTIGSGLSDLSNFKTMTLRYNWFNAGTYVGNAASVLDVSMYNSSDRDTLATPSATYNSGESFNDTQGHCV